MKVSLLRSVDMNEKSKQQTLYLLRSGKNLEGPERELAARRDGRGRSCETSDG